MAATFPNARPLAWLLACAAFVLLQWPLLTNPGYFSHDELQWGARASVTQFSALPWVGWTQVEAFQYRPLTLNLWLMLSWLLFDTPLLMHALWLGFGFSLCALLYSTLRYLRAEPRIALAGATAFALNPFALYVHGWVATLGELLWAGAALVLTLGVLRRARDATRLPAALGCVLTALALLSKETALAITPLLALAWLVSGRERRWLAAGLGSAAPTLIYLAMRLPLLMFAPRPDGAYAWSISALPLRWAELQTFPFLVTALEFSSVAQASPMRIALAAAVAAGLALCLWRVDRRLMLFYLIGGAFALGPALMLERGYPQYGYAYSALACACLALAWSRLRRPGRALLSLALLLSTWHGVNVQRELRRVGELQATFSPSLARAAQVDGDLTLRVARSSDEWIYRRLSFDVPSYRGVPLGERVRIATGPALASHVVDADGQVRAVER